FLNYLFVHAYRAPLELNPFPTRRSSDLKEMPDPPNMVRLLYQQSNFHYINRHVNKTVQQNEESNFQVDLKVYGTLFFFSQVTFLYQLHISHDTLNDTL